VFLTCNFEFYLDTALPPWSTQGRTEKELRLGIRMERVGAVELSPAAAADPHAATVEEEPHPLGRFYSSSIKPYYTARCPYRFGAQY